MLGAALGLATAYVVWAALNGRPVPMVSGVRGAFWAVLALGFAMCAVGGIGTGLALSGGNWLDPFMLAGIALGAAALGVAGAVALGARLPMIADDRAALLALAGIVAAKFVVASAHGVIAALAR